MIFDSDTEEYKHQMETHPRLQSYVADRWFVSTAWRESSALDGGWYYETMVFEWDKNTRRVGDILYSDSGSQAHFRIIKLLWLEGDSGLKAIRYAD